MAKQKVEVEVSKEAHELLTGLANVVRAFRAALADGWQPETDVPQVVLFALRELPQALQGLDKVADEYASERRALLNAVCVGASNLVDAALPVKAPEVAPQPESPPPAA